uniref:Uncharacterized protein n=1 Tax=Sphaerodactylus townsendi TaxID=933632 RepID=A0ACB8EYC0_9SAUR
MGTTFPGSPREPPPSSADGLETKGIQRSGSNPTLSLQKQCLVESVHTFAGEVKQCACMYQPDPRYLGCLREAQQWPVLVHVLVLLSLVSSALVCFARAAEPPTAPRRTTFSLASLRELWSSDLMPKDAKAKLCHLGRSPPPLCLALQNSFQNTVTNGDLSRFLGLIYTAELKTGQGVLLFWPTEHPGEKKGPAGICFLPSIMCAILNPVAVSAWK